MAITIRGVKPGTAPTKRNIASLVGGYVIALGCLVLFLLVASELTTLSWPIILAGVVVAGGVGVWIRLADF